MNETGKLSDLTHGSILGKLLHIAVPIMGTQLLQMAYNLTDMFWLGRVSSDAVAASGTAGMYLWLSMAFLMIGRMGAEIGVSQSMGSGNTELARRYSQNSLFLALALGVAVGAVLVLFRVPLIGFFQIREANVAADAALYLAVTGMAVPASFIAMAITGTFNGSGNARTPFFIHGVGLIANMILDPYLISTRGMGIFGAAIATALAQVLVCVLFLVAIKLHKHRPFAEYSFFTPPNRGVIGQIFRWSTPIGLENMLFTILTMFVSRFVAAWGADAIAVQRVCSQIESLSWLLGGGFGTAITSFVGQNFGAGKWTRVHSGFRLGLVTLLCWGLIVTLALAFAGGKLFALFLPDDHRIIQMGASYLAILAVCQIPFCMEASASGAFRGIGRTLPSSIVSIASNTLRVPIAYFLSVTSLGLNGIWWGLTIGATLRGVWIFLWFLQARRKFPTQDEVRPVAQE